MSVPRTCPACMDGNHAAHNRDWNIRPGVLGGAWCPCKGGCADLHDPNARMFASYGLQPPTTGGRR